jgi:hypothetical protein
MACINIAAILRSHSYLIFTHRLSPHLPHLLHITGGKTMISAAVALWRGVIHITRALHISAFTKTGLL